ncbi:GntR family transcriptional regulator [Acinetobacter bereziniae]|jgi:DNA-binding GntR family transcriptional regulator|uniref:GntR family transcriptional regulator n=1 Tax=Acinetobacter TaxID=469 RepID=UPI000C2C4FC4|nr:MULTISPECIES: GntR family transcriptional regulator [Acinetobacter]MBJ9371976.1 GntR family transcriptional regulator [Acinetobacter sp. TGL-Y2]MCU4435812.1 GntR family transcriptional regulator [Acinetobacter bereziniae]MCV2442478.1 GntR family transcriptional regulator [Acinetobacter bereziniae]MDG3556315.1 GntR family transcriptional regulator [Acinetobacter bereziniae]MDP6002944.1 GntR family transcriptional regulator [Acinetobacter bereziniae]
MTEIKNSLKSSDNLSELVYRRIKNDIFDFKLMPSERFTESEIAKTYQVSRTPIRQALYRLQQEGYVEVSFRSGWQVRPLNFRYYEELYDVRIILEKAAIEILCAQIGEPSIELAVLKDLWCIEPEQYLKDIKALSQQDEDFHCSLVRAAGNQEMARIHRELSEKIRIIRRLDFSKQYRIEATYAEHQTILGFIFRKERDSALNATTEHIKQSRDEVKKITLQMLDTSQFI